jgi:hypothetical protein
MEKQLEFDFMKDLRRQYPDLDREDVDKAMDEITADARQEFDRLMDKYGVERGDREAIHNYANWSI